MPKGLKRATSALLIAFALYSLLGFLILPGIGLRIANQQLEASVAPQPCLAQDKDLHQARLHLALVGSGFTTEIKRGENRHKQLPHDFVVLTLVT